MSPVGTSDHLDTDSHENGILRRIRKTRIYDHSRVHINPNNPTVRITRSHHFLRSAKVEPIDMSSVSRHNGEEFRRSSRQRKLIHDTFNESILTSIPTRRSRNHSSQEIQDGEEDSMDMYTRVKRARRKVKRDMYGIPIAEEGNHTEEDATTGNEEEEEEDDEAANGDEESGRVQYNLRQNKPRTQHYEATIEKKTKHSYFKDTSPRKQYRERVELHYKSPAHRRHKRKRASHRSSSTSSSGSASEDERRFARRKSKSMAKARQRCLPMNLNQGDLTSVVKDRQKVGASLADVDPMSVDQSVTFDSVGGLARHIQALKEMIVFPLLYPEVFERFKISPPRGVLFHGPPGTGKTLVARALANECSSGEKKVAFFMRKGADCLSKWVGESERQLRLLFDQAYQMRPSIIFFDEIDGLAPVRSSRQDQIHSSIVSTLLALMDGLDSRGEVVVIGATNRIDSIDPALRRPGRFDREFLFTLPSAEARTEILRIHTREWNPPLLDSFIHEMAAHCNGYCGADMKALCTEAALRALRRRYPQIYTTKDKLQLDVSSIDISAGDFHHAMTRIVPAACRMTASLGRPLSSIVKPLLSRQLKDLIALLSHTFPFTEAVQQSSTELTELLDMADDQSQSVCITGGSKSRRRSRQDVDSPVNSFFDFTISAHSNPVVSRPKLLIHGEPSLGHTSHLAPALIHAMERIPTHLLDLPTLYANSSRTAEESCTQVFREACRSTPSIIYIPRLESWWQVLSDAMRATFLHMVESLDPLMPILVLATSSCLLYSLPPELRSLFSMQNNEQYLVDKPTPQEIRSFFEDLILIQTCIPPKTRKQAARNLLEVLPKAPAAKPAQLTETEEKTLYEQEEAVLRELRLFLRDMLNKLARDRKFNIFAKPVDDEEVPDYYEIIKTPMDLSTIMSKIDLHQYQTCAEFLADIDLICSNALEYNPADSTAGRAIRHRACALKDVAHALIDAELDQDFERRCQEVIESRKRRGITPSKSAPRYYHTRPASSSTTRPMRYSRRLRNEEVDVGITAVHKPESSSSSKLLAKDEAGTMEKKSSYKKRRRSRWANGFISRKKTTLIREPSDDELSEAESNKPEETSDFNRITNGTADVEDEDLCQPLSVGDVSKAKKALFESSQDSGVVSQPVASPAGAPENGAIENGADDNSNQGNGIDEVTGQETIECNTPAVQDNEIGEQDQAAQSECTPSIADRPNSKESDSVENSTSLRLTRSMTGDTNVLKCLEILEEPVPTFSVDSDSLSSLLDKAVSISEGFSVLELEKLYSSLAQKIYKHRMSYDRTEMLQEMNAVLDAVS